MTVLRDAMQADQMDRKARRLPHVREAGRWMGRQHAWMLSKMIAFDQVFRPIITTLDAADWQPEEEPS